MNTNHELELDRFDALVFDCDGTLADTMPAHFEAWTEIADKYGLTFSEERFYALGGASASKILAMLSSEQGVMLDPEAVAHEKEHLFFDKYLAHAREIEPIVAIARSYHGRKPLAVATGGIRKVIERCLDNLGIRDLFDTVVSCEDVAHHKPAPDTYLKAAERLGVAPERCCAFEDTDIGLQAARAAGMTAVDIRPIAAAR
jgi:beta-phosphoglucomutase family hydrolase